MYAVLNHLAQWQHMQSPTEYKWQKLDSSCKHTKLSRKMVSINKQHCHFHPKTKTQMNTRHSDMLQKWQY